MVEAGEARGCQGPRTAIPQVAGAGTPGLDWLTEPLERGGMLRGGAPREPEHLEGGRPWVERAGRADAGVVHAIAEESLHEPWTRLAYSQELGRADACVWIARPEPGGEPAGFLAGRLVIDELHVLAVGVRRAARRGGLARALVAAAVAEARSRGALRAHLEVRAGNCAALGLYRRAGFAIVGRRPRYYANGEDALLMTSQLSLEEEG